MVCRSYIYLCIILFVIGCLLIYCFVCCICHLIINLYYQLESSEDILAKYRKKPSNILNTNENNSSQKLGIIKNDEASVSEMNKNIDFKTYSFNDAKKKMRLVLSTVDVQYVPWCNETESKPMVIIIFLNK